MCTIHYRQNQERTRYIGVIEVLEKHIIAEIIHGEIPAVGIFVGGKKDRKIYGKEKTFNTPRNHGTV